MKRLLLLAAVIALAGSTATAADKKKPAESPAIPAATEDEFKKLDTNGNGKLSLEEFRAMFEVRTTAKGKKGGPDPFKLFGELDADNSNSLSLAEFKNLKPADLSASKKKK